MAYEYQNFSSLGVNLARQKFGALDISQVFTTQADLTYYLTKGATSAGISDYWKGVGAYPYEGQFLATVIDNQVVPYILSANGDTFATKQLATMDDLEDVIAGDISGIYLPIAGGNITGNLTVQGETVATQPWVTGQITTASSNVINYVDQSTQALSSTIAELQGGVFFQTGTAVTSDGTNVTLTNISGEWLPIKPGYMYVITSGQIDVDGNVHQTGDYLIYKGTTDAESNVVPLTDFTYINSQDTDVAKLAANNTFTGENTFTNTLCVAGNAANDITDVYIANAKFFVDNLPLTVLADPGPDGTGADALFVVSSSTLGAGTRNKFVLEPTVTTLRSEDVNADRVGQIIVDSRTNGCINLVYCTPDNTNSLRIAAGGITFSGAPVVDRYLPLSAANWCSLITKDQITPYFAEIDSLADKVDTIEGCVATIDTTVQGHTTNITELSAAIDAKEFTLEPATIDTLGGVTLATYADGSFCAADAQGSAVVPNTYAVKTALDELCTAVLTDLSDAIADLHAAIEDNTYTLPPATNSTLGGVIALTDYVAVRGATSAYTVPTTSSLRGVAWLDEFSDAENNKYGIQLVKKDSSSILVNPDISFYVDSNDVSASPSALYVEVGTMGGSPSWDIKVPSDHTAYRLGIDAACTLIATQLNSYSDIGAIDIGSGSYTIKTIAEKLNSVIEAIGLLANINTNYVGGGGGGAAP